jgi:hypothetical protein
MLIHRNGFLTSQRQTVRNFGVETHPEAVDRRVRATGRKVHRKAFDLLGPFHQIHWDDHEREDVMVGNAVRR